MNILIIGEFSSFAKHLRNGFVALGHEVVCVRDGDGFKKIPSSEGDIVYNASRGIYFMDHHIPLSGILYAKATNKYILNELHAKNQHYDLVVILCNLFLTTSNFRVGVPKSYIEHLVGNGSKVIFTSCGGDYAYQFFRHELFYFKNAFRRSFRNVFNEYPFQSRIELMNWLLEISNSIIATTYDYYYTMKRYSETYYCKPIYLLYKYVPITITPATIKSCVGKKVEIFHGVIRPEHKGTPFIVPAMERLKEKYPDKVEITIKGNIPYEEYCKLFDKVDILIDQCNGYGMGLNANIGLMNGKVVLTNNEPEEERIRGFKCPAINIRPDENQIYDVLEGLINNPERIDQIKQESREYAEKYLDSKIVAKFYLESVGLA